MAGIGFELKKIIREGTVASYLQVALSGAMIVAGPWIITILAIGFIQQFYKPTISEGANLFLATVVYTYSGSLVLFGGVHYLFSRILSDLLYERRVKYTFYYLVWFSLLVGILAVFVGGFLGFSMDPIGIHYPNVYRLVTVLFFCFVSIHWVFLLYASLLRWYRKILGIYVGGMGLFILLSFLLSNSYGVTGVLGGFAVGNLAILVGLMYLSTKFHREVRDISSKQKPGAILLECSRQVAVYLKNQKDLFLTGYVYYLAIWIDKFILWIGKGETVEGSWFRLFPAFDILVYYTNLAMIPGLVFFVVFTETGFATYLRKFLEGLLNRTYLSILREKRRLFGESVKLLVELGVFQGCIIISIALLYPYVFPHTGLESMVLLLLGGVFFHLLFFVLMSFLFFLEAYREALISSLTFLGVNSLITLGSVLPGLGSIFPLLPPGSGYFAGALFSNLFVAGVFLGVLRRIEQRIFSRSAEG